MAFELVTGVAGEPHVTSEQDALLNVLLSKSDGNNVIVSQNSYGIGMGDDNFKDVTYSGTTVQIGTGAILALGRLIIHTTNDTIVLDDGIANNKRVDIICIKYEKEAQTGIESARFEVLKGTSGANYVDPYISSNTLIAGGYSNLFPLYRVKIDGIAIESVEYMFNDWHIDTGWDESAITPNFDPFSGMPSVCKARAIGDMVFVKGIEYLRADFTDGQMTATYDIGNYSPREAVTINLGVHTAAGGTFYTNTASVGTDGTMTVTTRLLGESTSPVYVTHNLDGIYWFLD